MKIRHFLNGAAMGLALLSVSCSAPAQFAGPPAGRDNFRDTTVLRPPAGSKVALIVFEDLGCPACARAHPYEQQAIQQTHVPLLRYDFPLEAHIWTFEGAVYARYIQDKISPALAEEFRSAVFAAQRSIASKDDLEQFTSAWLQKHGKPVPAPVDPTGALAKEVTADLNLGKRLNVEWTPTVVVVTRNQYQAVCGTAGGACDPTQILAVIQGALAQTK
jgi:protein-disulfide isomerase